MTKRCFEHDDFPRNREHTLAVFDDLNQRFPNFRVTMFGIPGEMNDQDFEEVGKRREWMRLGVHGFYHDKAECREPTVWRQYLPWLDRLAQDERWDGIFKAPWHGIGADFAVELAAREFIVCIKCIPFFPYPMPDGILCSCLHDHWYATNGDNATFVESHPVYEDPRYFKAMESGLTPRNLKVMTRGWTTEDEFVFSEDVARPLCLKIAIGCETEDESGWTCLETLSYRLPWGAMKADAVVMSNVKVRLPPDDYLQFFEDVFRVLRPGAVFRFNDGTNTEAISAMRKVGFAVVESKPGETLSPHKDVLRIDERRREWVEAIKAVAVQDITRASHRRPAPPRDTRHLYEAMQ